MNTTITRTNPKKPMHISSFEIQDLMNTSSFVVRRCRRRWAEDST